MSIIIRISRFLFFALVLMIQACSQPPENAAYKNPNADQFVEFHPVIDEYVRQTHGWAQDLYHIEFYERDGEALVFWVVYSDDLKDTAPRCVGNCGKSFAVLLDPNAGRVTKELAFQ